MNQAETRRITAVVSGISKQRITNYVSPEGIGRILKPFVMLESFDSGLAKVGEPTSFPMHSHSGIVTMTYLIEGNGVCLDSTGSADIVEGGSIEWLLTGKGVWHKSVPTPGVRTRGVQLWIALPPEEEDAAPLRQHLKEREIPREGGVAVLIGCHGSLRSPVTTGSSINCFTVRLADGESWHYQPPLGHSVGWILSISGAVKVGGAILSGNMGVFSQDHNPITAVAEGEAHFLFGCSTEHQHALVREGGSIHTNSISLEHAREEISRIGVTWVSL